MNYIMKRVFKFLKCKKSEPTMLFLYRRVGDVA